MNYLLLKDDEHLLRRFLVEELGLAPLGHSPDDDEDLPTQAMPGYGRWELVFWAHAVGPLRRLGERDEPVTFDDRAHRLLNEQALGDRWRDAIDLARTPVIRLKRSSWNRNGHLNPGLLAASDAPVAQQPKPLLAIRRQVERWLKNEGQRLNPFDHCDASPIPQPANLRPFWTWARPHALAWVHAGGQVWPWNA